MDRERRHAYWQLGIGLFLVIVGILLLLDRFDIVVVGPVWHFWPLILVAIGLGRIADARDAREYRKAFFWLFFGGWFLVNELHVLSLNYHNSWPLLMIGWGISMLWKSGNDHPSPQEDSHAH